MGKIVFWLVVIFGALFVLRIVNASKLRRSRKGNDAPSAALPMVQCRQCRVYLPRAEAQPVADGFRCADGGCAQRR
ncbi:MAG: PP0621 family protein [Casimicrobiaceae bacterium]